ncbi:MAG: hypothetical protein WC205_08610 [Opitutaceae bacterium]|jgi:hypothetical protein
MNTPLARFGLTLLLLSLCSARVLAQDLTARNGAIAKMDKGEVVVTLPDSFGEWPAVTGLGNKKTPAGIRSVTIEFEIRSNTPLSSKMVVSEFNTPYTYYSDIKEIQIDGTWRKQRITFELHDTGTTPLNLPLFLFDDSAPKGEVRIRGWKVSFDGKPAAN